MASDAEPGTDFASAAGLAELAKLNPPETGAAVDDLRALDDPSARGDTARGASEAFGANEIEEAAKGELAFGAAELKPKKLAGAAGFAPTTGDDAGGLDVDVRGGAAGVLVAAEAKLKSGFEAGAGVGTDAAGVEIGVEDGVEAGDCAAPKPVNGDLLAGTEPKPAKAFFGAVDEVVVDPKPPNEGPDATSTCLLSTSGFALVKAGATDAGGAGLTSELAKLNGAGAGAGAGAAVEANDSADVDVGAAAKLKAGFGAAGEGAGESRENSEGDAEAAVLTAEPVRASWSFDCIGAVALLAASCASSSSSTP